MRICRISKGSEAGGGPGQEAVAPQYEGASAWNQEHNATVTRLENFKTEVVLEGKPNGGWRQDPLLNQSHRTQCSLATWARWRAGKDGTTDRKQGWEGWIRARGRSRPGVRGRLGENLQGHQHWGS